MDATKVEEIGSVISGPDSVSGVEYTTIVFHLPDQSQVTLAFDKAVLAKLAREVNIARREFYDSRLALPY